MDEEASERVVHQRIRTQIMATAELFADGAEGVRVMGSPGSWINWFFDWKSEPDSVDYLSTLTSPERAQLKALWHLVDQCCSETKHMRSVDELIATGWPDRIAPTAKTALQMMASRGVFSEVQGDEPSQVWPRSGAHNIGSGYGYGGPCLRHRAWATSWDRWAAGVSRG